MYEWELQNRSVCHILVVRTPACRVAGFCSFWLVVDELHINNLAVAPNAQPVCSLVGALVSVNDFANRRGGDRNPLAILDRDRAFRALGHDQGRHLDAELGERALEVGAAGQLQRLILVGEEQVDAAAVDHPAKAFLAPGDAHAFAQREGDPAPGRMGDVDRLHHRRARLVRAEQIAFQEQD